MNIKASMKGDSIEIIFDDYYMVKDFEAVNRILLELSKIRKAEEIK